MKIIFMGTPEFAVPALQMLLQEGYDIITVVTQPDRPKGRKRILTPSPVKVEAQMQGIPIHQPEKLRHPDSVAHIVELAPDLIVTAAYGQILPKSILQIPQHGCLNLHGSLLPHYRGGAPIQHALLNGEMKTGITLMYMAEGLDTGDMIAKVELPITDQDTTGTLFDKLSHMGAELLRNTLPRLLAGHTSAEPQNHANATLAPNLTRADEEIRWHQPTRQLFNQIRGLNPWPGAFTLWNGQVFKIWESTVDFNPADIYPNPPSLGTVSDPPRQGMVNDPPKPGTVLQITDYGIEVSTGEGTLWLTEVQPSGKKRMDAAQFRRGNTMEIGTVLGQELHALDWNKEQ